MGYREVPGRPALYSTTRTFLDDLNLRSLDELPPLEDLGALVESEPVTDQIEHLEHSEADAGVEAAATESNEPERRLDTA